MMAATRTSFVTAAEVARAAGVSRSAVSRAFTPGTRIAPATREHVRRTAEALGYRVNRVAQSLISARSKIVGLIGANLETPFHARQVALISARLAERGLQCFLLNASGDRVDAAMELLLESRVRAVIVLSGSPAARLVEECRRNGLRVIEINRRGSSASDTIVADDQGGARLACKALLEGGCRRLALVGSGSRTPSIRGRMLAFAAAAAQAKVPLLVWDQGMTAYETGHTAAEQMALAEVDGAFCVTDLLALGFLDGVRHRLGRNVPGSLSVIGFDDIPPAGWSAYRLTTLRQPLEAMTDALMDLLDDTSTHAAARIVLPVSLVRRDTLRSGTAG